MSEFRLPTVSQGLRRDETFNTMIVKSHLGIPVTREAIIDDVPPQGEGSLIYQSPSAITYRSNGMEWLPFVSADDIALSSVGGGTSLVNDPNGPNMKTKSLVGGTGITITTDIGNTTITISNTGGVLTVTSGTSGGANLIASTSTSQNIILRTLVAGTAIVVSEVGTDQISIGLDLSSPLFVTSVTTALPPFLGSVPILADEINPGITVKSLVAGANCTLVDNGSYITINMGSGPSTTTTLATVVGSTGQSFVVNGTGPALTMKGIIAGSGIALTPTATDIIIDATAVVPVGVNSIIAGAGIDVSPPGGQGDVTISISTATNTPGTYAYLAGTILSSPPNVDVTYPYWAIQWNQGNIFNNGIITIPLAGVYIITWGYCADSISCSYQLCWNGVCIQAISSYDNNTSTSPVQNGDGAGSGSLSLYCNPGDVLSMRHDNVTDIMALARRTGSPGGTYMGCTYIPNSIAPGQPHGFYARLVTFINGYPGNTNITAPLSSWEVLWTAGNIFNNGTATIAITGLYYVSWATCVEDTGCSTSLFIAGNRIQSKNCQDDDGQGVNWGSGVFPIPATAVVALQNNFTQDIYGETRGNSGILGATYLSVVKVA